MPLPVCTENPNPNSSPPRIRLEPPPSLPFASVVIHGQPGRRYCFARGRNGEIWYAGPYASSAEALARAFDEFRTHEARTIAGDLALAERQALLALHDGDEVYTDTLVALGLISVEWKQLAERVTAVPRLSALGLMVAATLRGGAL